jgi:hypothetical protein
MLYDLMSNLPEMRHIAYLTVLTSLTTKATESTLANHLFTLILEDERHSTILYKLFSRNLELESDSYWDS